jgi:LPS O-antigen subunit length determinant protein (WzzB/FepE family)
MTTYQHTITIGDGEYSALTDALKLMIEHCEAQIKAGEGAPYYAYRQYCNEMLNKLQRAPAQMTSTNNFFNDR